MRDIQKLIPQVPQLPAGGQMVWIPPGFELSGEPPARPKESHLWDYIWLAWRGRRLITLCFILCMLIAGLRMHRATPIYQASAKLLMGTEPSQIVNVGNTDGGGSRLNLLGGSESIGTRIQVLESKTLARKVIEDQGLWATEAQGPKPEPAWDDKLVAGLTSVPQRLKALVSQHEVETRGEAPQETEATRAEHAMVRRIAAFQNLISVLNPPSTEVVVVSFRDTNPVRCAQVTNSICDTYVKMADESSANSNQDAIKWIDQKLSEVKANLEKSDEALYEFAGDQDASLLANGAEGLSASLAATAENLRQVEQELHDRRFELETLEKGVPGDIVTAAAAASAAGAATDQSGTKTASALESLQIQLRKCEMDYALAKEKFGPGMTEVKTLKATKDQLEAQIQALTEEETSKAQSKTQEDTKHLIARTQFAYDQIASKRDFLKEKLASLTEQQLRIQQRLVKYNILKREVDVNQELYTSLLQRSREVGLRSGMNPSGVSVIERAEEPQAPVFPDKKNELLTGAMAGLLLGIGLVFFREYMDRTVRGAQDVERIGKMATLGLLPHVEAKWSKKGRQLVPGLLTADRPTSGFAESVRQIRTALQYSLAGSTPKTILVTSALPSEGKTTVAANLAISLAQSGRRTVLVDADLKNPSVHKLFEMGSECGLSDILAGKMDGNMGPEFQAGTGHLYVLPAGVRPPNPVDLLDSPGMRRLLTTLATHFDHVIVDSSPILDQSDASVLFRHVDGVVLVVKPGKTPRATLVREGDWVKGAGGHLLGVVLNDRKSRSSKRHGSYHYLYGYGNGNGKRNGQISADGQGSRVETSNLVLPSPKAS